MLFLIHSQRAFSWIGVAAIAGFLAGVVATMNAEVIELSLEEAEEWALSQNPSLCSKTYGAWQASARFREAWGQWLPSVSATAYSKRTPQIPLGNYGTTYQEEVAFDQKVVSSQAYFGVRLSAKDEVASWLDVEGARNDLLFQVRQAYYTLVLNRQQVCVQEEHVSILAEALDQDQKKLAVGRATSFQVNQSKVSLANALSAYYNAVKGVQLAQNELLRVLGIDPDQCTGVDLKDHEVPVMSVPALSCKVDQVTAGKDQSEPSGIPGVCALLRESANIVGHGDFCVAPEGVVSPVVRCGALFAPEEIDCWDGALLRCLPSVRRQRVIVARARETMASHLGEYIPSVDIQGDYIKTNLARILSPRSSYGEIGVSFSWQLFDGFARENRYSESRAAWNAAQCDYETIVQQARSSLYDRLSEMEQALYGYLAARDGALLAEEAMDQAKERRKAGVITPLEYREAAASLADARLNFNQAGYDLLTAYYGLRHDSGVDTACGGEYRREDS